MSRQFDGGLTMPYRTKVRRELLTLLAPLAKVNGGFLQALVPLAGTLRSYDNGDGVNQLYTSLLGRAPAIGIACGDRSQQRATTAGNRHMSQLEVHLYFVSSHQRSLMARVESDVVSAGDGGALLEDLTVDPGVEATMELAEELLTGQPIDSSTVVVAGVNRRVPREAAIIKDIALTREEDLYTSNQHTIWMQTYQVAVTRSINRHRGIVARLASVSTNVHPAGDAASEARVEAITTIPEPA